MKPSSNFSSRLLMSVALAALLGGCVYPGSSTCGDGRICPANTRCDEQHNLCVSDAQEAACTGQIENAACQVALAPGVCQHGQCQLFRCGDNVRTGTEACDGIDLADMTCAKLNFYGQTTGLKCKDDCTFDTSGCTGACGDRMINGAELCDGADLGGTDCRTAGFYDGPGLRCSPFCTLDVSACTGFCGDAQVNGPEQCDGAPPLGKTCVDYGFDRGLVGCSALCGPDLSGCGQIGWRTVLAGAFNDLWGAARDDLFAVGPAGKIVRGNGTTWAVMNSGTIEDLLRVWGSGPNDVFAVGISSILHWNGSTWSSTRLPAGFTLNIDPIHGDVWGSGPNDVYVVGFGSPPLHWDGSTWSTLSLGAFVWSAGVWGTGPKDVYIVGDYIRHWDGSTWFATSTPMGGADKVWGSGAKDVLACGSAGCAHWDGKSWSQRLWSADLSGQVSDLWGSGPNDVLAVVGRRLLHWDGATWSEVPSAGSPRAIWGTGPDDVFVAGSEGLQHRTDESWLTTNIPWPIRSLWAAGPDELFVGDEPAKQDCGPGPAGFVCPSVIVPDVATTAWPKTTAVVDLWGSGVKDVFAVDSEGAILHWDGLAWSASFSGIFALRVWGSGPSDVFALGVGPNSGPVAQQIPRMARWDGRQWSLMELPAGTGFLSAVWTSGGGEAFAVGSAGAIVHLNGAIWSRMESGTREDLADVWGSGRDDIFAVGAHGTVLHYDGATWTQSGSGTIPSDSYLYQVRGSGRGDVFVVAGYIEPQFAVVTAGDRLFHRRSSGWERIGLPASARIVGLAVTSSTVSLGLDRELRQLYRESVSCTGPEASCGDGWDNDCDGLADEADPDCKGKVVEQCANLVDDDGNGLADCADPGCATFPTCRHR